MAFFTSSEIDIHPGWDDKKDAWDWFLRELATYAGQNTALTGYQIATGSYSGPGGSSTTVNAGFAAKHVIMLINGGPPDSTQPTWIIQGTIHVAINLAVSPTKAWTMRLAYSAAAAPEPPDDPGHDATWFINTSNNHPAADGADYYQHSTGFTTTAVSVGFTYYWAAIALEA